MNEVAVLPRTEIAVRPVIPPMRPEAIDKAREAESIIASRPQVPIFTDHVLHAGIYSRTIMIPARVALAAALIKIPTHLVFDGNALVYIGEDDPLPIEGRVVIAASAGRKQVFVAITNTWLTMSFATTAKDIEEAERQFTDEYEMLGSHRDPALNSTTITGE